MKLFDLEIVIENLRCLYKKFADTFKEKVLENPVIANGGFFISTPSIFFPLMIYLLCNYYFYYIFMESKQGNTTNMLLAIIIALLICIFIYLVTSQKAQAPGILDQYRNESLEMESQAATPNILIE